MQRTGLLLFLVFASVMSTSSAHADENARGESITAACEFRAFGNEPFWHVDIAMGGIVFSELGRHTALEFPYSPPLISAGQRIYRSKIDEPDRHHIAIVLDETRCIDTMADAYYKFTAYVILDGRSYQGCARDDWR